MKKIFLIIILPLFCVLSLNAQSSSDIDFNAEITKTENITTKQQAMMNIDGMCIVGRRVIPQYTTKNIMDYFVGSSDNRSVLFLYQINHLNK